MAASRTEALHNLRRRLARSVAQRGVLRTLLRGTARIGQAAIDALRELTPSRRRARRQDLDFDRRHQVQTSVHGDSGWLAHIRSPNWRHGVGYAPVPVAHGMALLEHLQIPYDQYTFIDFGAGKGRMLLLAARFPFREVIGVEYSPPLFEALQQNLVRCRDAQRRCLRVRGVLQDAAHFELPMHPLVLFFHHPFEEPVFRQILDRLEASLAVAPRDVRVVYYDPQCRRLFEESPRWQRLADGPREPGVLHASPWAIYGRRGAPPAAAEHRAAEGRVLPT